MQAKTCEGLVSMCSGEKKMEEVSGNYILMT